MLKKCILNDDKICDECGECDYCDINPFKRCDNCGKCINEDEEYRELKIDDVIINGESRMQNIKNHYPQNIHVRKEDDDCCCGNH